MLCCNIVKTDEARSRTLRKGNRRTWLVHSGQAVLILSNEPSDGVVNRHMVRGQQQEDVVNL